jgi:hypothetical protein
MSPFEDVSMAHIPGNPVQLRLTTTLLVVAGKTGNRIKVTVTANR